MKKILILFLAILIVAPFNQLAAQSATDLLNKTAKKLSTCGGIDASFEATTYKGSSDVNKGLKRHKRLKRSRYKRNCLNHPLFPLCLYNLFLISCQSGVNLPPIKKLGWMGST